MPKIKYLLTSILYFLMLPALGAGGAQVKGKIAISGGYYFFLPEGSKQAYSIVVTDSLVRARLSCLKDGDQISGLGSRIEPDRLYLRSIDYVGLRDLVGVWRNEHEVYEFIDFRKIYYWDFRYSKRILRAPLTFHYALSPYGESYDHCAWKIFLMDANSVILGSLEWSAEDQIHLQLYDSDTGEVTSTKHLIRSNN
jgi:hypothetical protein